MVQPTMKSNKFTRSFLLGLTLAAFSALTAKDKPNILIFLVDDMGLMDTSVPFVVDDAGKPVMHKQNQFYRTPNMEKLAAQGLRFTHFYANSVCSPTRLSLLNGQYSARHGVTQWINPSKKNEGPAAWKWQGLGANDFSVVSMLKESGYTTLHAGKAHLAPFQHVGADPLNLHFEHNIGGTAIGHPGSYFGTKNFGKGNIHYVPGLEKYHGKEIFLTEAITLETILKIKELSALEKPFFLHLSQYAVHSPFQSDPRFANNYKDGKESADLKTFATLIEGMDKSLGDVIHCLEAQGEAENTLIFFLGDNGSDSPMGEPHEYTSSAPYKGKKATHLEGGMLVPFIISWAKTDPSNPLQKKFPVKPGIITEQFGSICDILPTIAEVSGAPIPASHKVDGQSLVEQMARHTGPHKQQFLMHYPHAHRSVNFTAFRNGDWKCIKYYDSGTAELYNLKVDPYEKSDLAATNAEKLAEMQNQMQAALDDAKALYWENKK
jgi:arylsulfatase A-like enzyme